MNINVTVSRPVTLPGIGFCLVLSVLQPLGAWAGDSASTEPSYPSTPVMRVDRDLLLGYLADSSSLTLIDARSNDEYLEQHLPGAINVPFDAVDVHAAERPQDKLKLIVVYCRSGKRAGLLKAALVARGYRDGRVLPREQIFWEDDFMAFNCGTK